MNKIITYSQSDMIQLTQKIKAKYEQTTNKELITNTTKSNYSHLAEVINHEMNSGDDVKDSWLRSLFSEHIQKKTKDFSTHIINLVEGYCSDIDDTSDVNSNLLEGEYDMYWRANHYSKKIDPNLYIEHMSFKKEEIALIISFKNGTVRYKSKSRNLLSGGVEYIEFEHEQGLDIVYMILQRGNASSQLLDFIPGIYLAVDSIFLPSSGPFLLVKKGVHSSQNIIDNFFDCFDFTSIKTPPISELIKLSKQKAKKDLEAIRLEGFYDTWFVLSKTDDQLKIDVSTITLHKDSIHFESRNNRYTEGNIRIFDNNNLIITLENTWRFATIICNIGKDLKTHNINQIVASYTASGLDVPTHGLSFLVRVQSIDHPPKIGAYTIEELEQFSFSNEIQEAINQLYTGLIPSLPFY